MCDLHSFIHSLVYLEVCVQSLCAKHGFRWANTCSLADFLVSWNRRMSKHRMETVWVIVVTFTATSLDLAHKAESLRGRWSSHFWGQKYKAKVPVGLVSVRPCSLTCGWPPFFWAHKTKASLHLGFLIWWQSRLGTTFQTPFHAELRYWALGFQHGTYFWWRLGG